MIRLLVSFIILTGFASNMFAQCNTFYQFSEGTSWEMESYNQRGKVQGTTAQEVTNFEEHGNGFTAIITSEVSDDKGKDVVTTDMEIICENGLIHVDMQSFLNQEQMQALGNYELEVEAENLEIPSTLTVGQTLNDASITVTAIDSPIPMSMTVTITDRKVEAQESITTPAGTFETYKITSNSNVNTKMGLGMNFSFSYIDWLAPEVATVKSETYRNGKLQGYTLLTKRN